MKINHKKGIAIFIAVISVSALLLIALAISDISYKEQIISFASKDSKIALYAADTGMECVLFYDLKGGPSGTFRFANHQGTGSATTISCGGNSSVRLYESNVGGVVMTTFYFNPAQAGSACAFVTVGKTYNAGEDVIKTVIDARGYNTTCSGTGSTPTIRAGNRNLERAFQITY